MRSETEIVPYDRRFPGLLRDYLEQIKDAVKRKKHHDQRRSLFMSFLRKAFGVEPEEVVLEEKVKADEVRGRIDALYKYVIFEFKTDLKKERDDAERELRKYFSSRKNPEEYYGLVSDGLSFDLYQLEKKELCKVAEFKLKVDDPLGSWRSLDNILFVGKRTTPGANDISAAFGAQSAVFNKCRTKLLELFESVKSSRHVEVKFNEWNSLLGKVYGEKLGNPDLFVRHTYLTMLSRLMVAKALVPAETLDKEHFLGIITGAFFSSHNLPNLAEPDFFSWALDTEIEHDFVGFLFLLEKYINRFKFDNVGEDILKEIYQELVDPASRHALGEYYTPDWIADVTLDAIDYKDGTVLDPACGSGTFLVAVIRKLRREGASDKKLLQAVQHSVTGIDAHPVAVIMTKVNLILSLITQVRRSKREVYLPVYMADTLMYAEESKSQAVEVPTEIGESFLIPVATIRRGINFAELVDKILTICKLAGDNSGELKLGFDAIEQSYLKGGERLEIDIWRANIRLLWKLMQQGRDTVWGFILKNAYRPAFIRYQKVDYVLGNPPWLSYRYIRDPRYKARVKELVIEKHELLNRSDTKLFTQMDTSTLFFAYSERHFLKPGGTIAFVLPKTTVLPSRQHRNFQNMGVTEIHDFTEVSPLFNVRSVVVHRTEGKTRTSKIPTYIYTGTLPRKNLTWVQASKHIKVTRGVTEFSSVELRSHYYPKFLQGATIVPRCFWFVQRQADAVTHNDTPHVETSNEAFDEAKDPWKVREKGRIEHKYLFETLLGKGLLPFAAPQTETVFLPLRCRRGDSHMLNSTHLIESGDLHAAEWLRRFEKLWERDRQSAERTLTEWLNYNQKLTNQNANAQIVVLYNASGTNLAAALYIVGQRKLGSFKTCGFVAESVTYYYYPEARDEGNYLVSVLNSDVVNMLIKDFQPQGLFGERHIHRRPFEVCAIPRFDSKNPIHAQLAKLGRECREEMDQYVDKLEGRVGKLRQEVRSILKTQITKINRLVKQLLAEEGQNLSQLSRKKKKIVNGDLFKDNGL